LTAVAASDPSAGRAPIVWFSDVPADFHNVESRTKLDGLARAGHPVLWVDQLGVANPRPRNLAKAVRYLLRRARGRARPPRSGRPQAQLLLAPPRHHRLTDEVNARWLERQLRSRLAAAGMRRPILWFRYPTPELVRLVGRLDEGLVVYECLDRYAAFGYPRRAVAALERAERRLLRAADVTIVSSEGLRRLAERDTDRVVLHRVGVDDERFRAGGAPPADLARLPAPRLGYTGALDERVDAELLVRVAGDHPGGSVVVIGPVADARAARLVRAAPNVHLLGARPHAAMPAYLGGLDVALLPYRSTPVTDVVFPVKCLEYLASGLPCVATGLPELGDLDDVIAVAPDAGAFRAAVAEAVGGRGVGTVEARRARAAEYRWAGRIAGLVAIVEAAQREREAREGGRRA
jgi:glycosyltransferase involved in cell wall biosynthesis